MKKFEEEVKRPSNAGIDPFSKRDVSFEKLSSKFTKGAQTLKEWKEYAFKAEDKIRELESQLKKQQPEIPEVPQFVADWHEENKGSLDYMIFETCRDLTDESTDEFENWFGYDENKAITTLVHMKNGYTVKEKRFYLKHKSVLIFDPDSDDSDVEELYLGAGGNFVPYKHLAKIFTQQEIDSMETGSYEQIEVAE
ncbi:DUF1642 domain-containing protein [Lactococcus sp. bn62]|uniref:DUF1642 domain-containing protein n=1 Tax=Lactococcus sp. bn62 TaxID=3037457 RepID=UPI0024C4B5FA|nr:DUF1642 domain-containing protein [Lactococcus sp. bn62]WKY24630.1 DUF1642 domain-containing protein [Lactococcus sp. bn62]